MHDRGEIPSEPSLPGSQIMLLGDEHFEDTVCLTSKMEAGWRVCYTWLSRRELACGLTFAPLSGCIPPASSDPFLVPWFAIGCRTLWSCLES